MSPSWTWPVVVSGVLRKPFTAFLLCHDDVHNRLSSILKGLEVDVDVGREEHLGVPGKALACRYVRDLFQTLVSQVHRVSIALGERTCKTDQARHAIWITYVDSVGFGLCESGACMTHVSDDGCGPSAHRRSGR